MIDNYDENDYDEYNSACEFDDDRTCSTCSFSSSNSTSSTESDLSDLDDGFGCEPMESYRRGGYPRNSSSGQMQARSNFSSGGGGQRGLSGGDAFHRKHNSGLKISYVDSLPLARTNPAPQEPKKAKSSKKKKSISKFKKDNCTVS